MQKYKLTKIAPEPRTIQYTDKKTGSPRSFQTIGLQIEGNLNWINVSYTEEVQKWTVGDEVVFEITTTEKDGKTYYNGKLPAKEDILESRLNKVELVLKNL